MYLYFLLGWNLVAKYYPRWQKGGEETGLKLELQVRNQGRSDRGDVLGDPF